MPPFWCFSSSLFSHSLVMLGLWHLQPSPSFICAQDMSCGSFPFAYCVPEGRAESHYSCTAVPSTGPGQSGCHGGLGMESSPVSALKEPVTVKGEVWCLCFFLVRVEREAALGMRDSSRCARSLPPMQKQPCFLPHCSGAFHREVCPALWVTFFGRVFSVWASFPLLSGRSWLP